MRKGILCSENIDYSQRGTEIKMNILILSLAYAPYSGVGSARMVSLSKYLLDKKQNVTVVCYNSSVFGEEEQKRKIPEGVERIPVNKLQGKLKNIMNLKKSVEKVIQERNFHVCLSSVGPFETMFFIDKVCKKWKIPYIIDYRDPWLFEKNNIKLKGVLKFKIRLYQVFCLPVEKRIIESAEKIVFVSEEGRKDLIERYHIKKDKCRVIYNGYEDVPTDSFASEKKDFVIGIAGKFSDYNSGAAETFLSVCEEINHLSPIKVMHIGNKESLFERYHSNLYLNVGVKEHKAAMKELTRSKALLVCYAHHSGLGTKVFDYIALNKPIIYIGVVPSELSEFIRQFEHSYICQNREEMYEAVKGLMRKCPTSLTSEDVKKYSREWQNESYWKLINEIKIKEQESERI